MASMRSRFGSVVATLFFSARLCAHRIDYAVANRAICRRGFTAATAPAIACTCTGISASAADEGTLSSILEARPVDVRRLATDEKAVKRWCPPPDWLIGEWSVERTRFDGAWFSSGGLRPKSIVLGARMGTILALPNVGATPDHFLQRYDRDTPDNSYNDVQAFAAFWPHASSVKAELVSPTRRIVTYSAPTVSRGTRRQRAEVVVAARRCARSPAQWLVAEHAGQSTGIVDDDVADGALAIAAGEYTSVIQFDRLADEMRVRKRLRVAVFEPPRTPFDDEFRLAAPIPAAVYDYSFLLRRLTTRDRDAMPDEASDML